MPKPLALAFAETIFDQKLPLPAGLASHVAWVTFFPVVCLTMFRHRMIFAHAPGPSAALWLPTLGIFFPIVGRGFLGLNVSPMLMAGSAVLHLLFSIILWGLCRLTFHYELADLRGGHRWLLHGAGIRTLRR